MKIVFFGNGKRAYKSLKYLIEQNVDISLVVGFEGEKSKKNTIIELAIKNNLDYLLSDDPNDSNAIDSIKKYNPDLFILGGYSKILKKNLLSVPKLFTLNLHAGELPRYRGSSPLNWALINGEKVVTISIIIVDEGIDTGDIINQREIEVLENDTIKTIHEKANVLFPKMIIETIEKIRSKNYQIKKQTGSTQSYYPRRFPSDGFVLFDQLNSLQVHNKIKALTDPYPGAFGYYQGKKVKFLSSESTDIPYYGEPGRIYKKLNGKLLVCCKDQCIWITSYEVDGLYNPESMFDVYESFATVTNTILNNLNTI